MSNKYDMSKIDGSDSSLTEDSPTPAASFISPYAHGEEIIYIEEPMSVGMFHTRPEKRSRVTYIGTSYLKYGNDKQPQAIVCRNDLGREQLKLDFSSLRKV
jgi:hypothetical protein